MNLYFDGYSQIIEPIGQASLESIPDIIFEELLTVEKIPTQYTESLGRI